MQYNGLHYTLNNTQDRNKEPPYNLYIRSIWLFFLPVITNARLLRDLVMTRVMSVSTTELSSSPQLSHNDQWEQSDKMKSAGEPRTFFLYFLFSHSSSQVSNKISIQYSENFVYLF